MNIIELLRAEIAKADKQGGNIGYDELAFWMADHAHEILAALDERKGAE